MRVSEERERRRLWIERRVAAWERWRAADAVGDPDAHRRRDDFRLLAERLRGARITELRYNDTDQVIESAARNLEIGLTLENGKCIYLHVGITSQDTDRARADGGGPPFRQAWDAAEDAIYDHDLGLKITTFDYGGGDDPAAPDDWDTRDWRMVPGFDRGFLDHWDFDAEASSPD